MPAAKRPRREEPAAEAAAAPSPAELPMRAERPAPRPRPGSGEELLELLARCDGNVSRAAALVGRNRKQVYRWMTLHDVKPGTGRGGRGGAG